MKLVEVTVSISRKYQPVQFEPLEFFVSLKAELDHTEYDKVHPIADQLYQLCEKMIQEAYRKSALK